MGGANRRVRGALLVAVLALASAVAPQASAITYPQYTLTISGLGNGSGLFETTSSPGVADGKIHCQINAGVIAAGSDCTQNYTDVLFAGFVKVDYLVTATPGSLYCPGGECYAHLQSYYNVTGNLTVPTNFVLQTYTLTAAFSGAGTGHVISVPGAINCGTTCSDYFLFGSVVTLYAIPDEGAYVQGWTGKCAGAGSACIFTMPAGNTATNAVFGFGDPPASPAPSPLSTAGASKPPKTPAPTTAPHATPGRSSSPTSSVAAPSQPTSSEGPDASIAEPSVAGALSPSDSPALPAASAATTDLTPIVLAILGAGLLIALGIGAVGYALVRRKSSS